MVDEKNIDVVEETVETMAEPVAEIAKGIDWFKVGKAAGGAAAVAAGAYAAYKLVPKGINWAKTKIENRAESKKEKKANNMITVEEYEVNDVVEDEN